VNLFFNIVLLKGLPTLCGSISIVYFLLTISHVLFLSGTIRIAMASVSLFTTVFLLSLSFLSRTKFIGPKRANLSFFFVTLIGLVNTHLHLFLGRDQSQSINIVMLNIGYGILLMRHSSYFAIMSISVAGWFFISARIPQSYYAHYAFAMINSLALSVVIHFAARQVLIRLLNGRLELKKSLRTGNQQRSRLHRLTNASFEAMVSYSEGYISDINLQFSHLVGLPEHRIIGQNVSSFFLPGDFSLGWKTLEKNFNDETSLVSIGEDKTTYGAFLFSNGEIIPVEVRVSKMKAEEDISGVIVLRDNRDIIRANLFQEFIKQAATKFINVPVEEINRSLDDLLSAAGQYCGADRAYLFWIDKGGTTISNTHEWCRVGIEPQKEYLQNIPMNDLSWWTEEINKNQEIVIPRVSQLPESASTERSLLEEQNIESLLAIGLFRNGILVGFVGFDAVAEPKMFPRTEATILRVVAELCLNVLERKEVELQLIDHQKLFYQLTENISEVFYVLSSSMDAVHYLSPAFEEIWGMPRSTIYKDASIWKTVILPEDEQVIINRERQNQADISNLMRPFEFRIMRPDNTIRWIRAHSSPVRDENNEIVRIVGVAEDITAEKKQQREMENRRILEAQFGGRIQQTLLLGKPPENIQGIHIDASQQPPNPLAEIFTSSLPDRITSMSAWEM